MSDIKKIPSFMVDHHRLLRGIYLSRQDRVGDDWVSTFDIRIKEPNKEPLVDFSALHSIEHLGATWLRQNQEWQDKVIYFGPMGCRTGCYLLLKGNLAPANIWDLVRDMFVFIADQNDKEIPGATSQECGHWLSHDKPMAAWESQKFVAEVLSKPHEKNMLYPK